MLYEPEFSPWGPVQHCETLCPGAFQVSTAGHGGVMVNTEIVDSILSPEAQKLGFQDGGFLCYEEDCDAAIPLRELIDKGLYAAPTNEYYAPGEFSKIVDKSLRQWNPTYWAFYVKKQQKPSIKNRLAERTAYRAKRSALVANDKEVR